MTVKIKDKDRGWNAVRHLANEVLLKKPHVDVGITGERAGRVHAGGSGLTVVEIGTRHEMGLGVPQRSFIRSTFDENVDRYRDLLKRQFRETILYHARTQKPFDHRRSVALRRLGLAVTGDIKKKITAHIPPPLTPYTLARKGSGKTTPLINTGQLINSITYVVRP